MFVCIEVRLRERRIDLVNRQLCQLATIEFSGGYSLTIEGSICLGQVVNVLEAVFQAARQ